MRNKHKWMQGDEYRWVMDACEYIWIHTDAWKCVADACIVFVSISPLVEKAHCGKNTIIILHYCNIGSVNGNFYTINWFNDTLIFFLKNTFSFISWAKL